MKKAFDTKVYFRDWWLKNYTFVYVKIKSMHKPRNPPISILYSIKVYVE